MTTCNTLNYFIIQISVKIVYNNVFMTYMYLQWFNKLHIIK